jgi:hypothetical protein
MTDEGRKLLEAAMQLSPKERAELAAKLVDSVNTLAHTEQAWNSEVEARARRALAGELGKVHYLGAAPVPLRFDLDAELDLERAASLYATEPARVEAMLAELTDAMERIRGAPCSFGVHPSIPESLGVRRFILREQPQTVLFVPMSKEVRILALAHRYHPPGDSEITIEALMSVEDWLAIAGLRAATFAGLAAVTTAATMTP